MPDGPEKDGLEDLSERIHRAAVERETVEDKASPRDGMKDAVSAGSRVGVDMAASIVVCTGLGAFVDHFWGTSPWGLIVMMVAGFAVGLLHVWRALNGYGTRIGYRKD